MDMSAAAVEELAGKPQRQHSLRGKEGHDEIPASAQGSHHQDALAEPSTSTSNSTSTALLLD